MVKWIRKEAVRQSEHYQKIIAEAVERLSDEGCFEKEEVLANTNLTLFGDVIRWDYIREFIDQDHNIELIPLASVYFKPKHQDTRRDSRHGPDYPPEQFPERYIASGYGKKTAGFCIADRRNGHFVIKRLEQKRKKAIGAAKKANAMLDRVKGKGIIETEEMLMLGSE